MTKAEQIIDELMEEGGYIQHGNIYLHIRRSKLLEIIEGLLKK